MQIDDLQNRHSRNRREMAMGKLPHALLLSLLGACLASAWQPLAAETPAPPCAGAQRPKQVAELLFGRDIGRHDRVSESAFARFVARELSPRFPDGLTITDATGQWRDPADGRLVHEAAKQVEIVLPGNADDEARLEAVVTAYKREFHQHSVGVIVQSACVSF
jgi:hypothetical protein